MKKIFSFFICLVLIFSLFTVEVNASETDVFIPYVVEFTLTTDVVQDLSASDNTRASLIHSYGLNLSKTGNTLNITGRTCGSTEVVKSGFKDLTVERRKTSDDSWKDYYEYGNVYADAFMANLDTTLVVESGYQYRISCKHYAKKNIFSVQTIANTSGIVTVS